jgi:hypothetical protein
MFGDLGALDRFPSRCADLEWHEVVRKPTEGERVGEQASMRLPCIVKSSL